LQTSPDLEVKEGTSELEVKKSTPDLEVKEGSNILIVAQKRTGSTFLGTFLGSRDDTFYWHEPLRFTHRYHYFRDDDLLCDYSHPSCQIL